MKNVFYVLIFVLALLARAKAVADAPDPPGPLASITVSVSLEIQTGTVVVNATPDTASWSFTDGIGGAHAGTGDQTIPNVPVGLISLTWDALNRHDPPAAPPAQNLAKDGTITFTGVYVRHTGTVQVEVTPDAAPWTFRDGDGGEHLGTGSQAVIGVPTGEISLTWNSLFRYDPPSPPSPQSLEKDQTVIFNGVYTRRTGTVVVEATPDTASWSFTDGNGATHNGTGDAMVTGVPTGTITLTWDALADYDAPDPNPEAKTLPKNETVTFTGNYTHKANVEDWMLYE